MSEGLDRRIAALQADEKRLHDLYWLIPDEDLAGQRAAEVELNVIMEELDALYRERDEVWDKNHYTRLRDIANGYNPSEM